MTFDPTNKFRTVKFNMREFGDNFTGVHVWNYPYPCKLLKVSRDVMTARNMWITLYNTWEKNKLIDMRPEICCPECGAFLRISQRIYEGRAFCQQCGRHLTDADSMGAFWDEVK